jgi:acetoacetyl-CoA synthetase
MSLSISSPNGLALFQPGQLGDAGTAPGFGVARPPQASAQSTAMYESTPEAIAASQLTAFTAALEKRTGRVFPDYAALHDFSVRDYRAFWQFFVEWSQQRLEFGGSPEPVCVGETCEEARFFPQLKLNYADCLLNLSAAPAHAPALTACHADGRRLQWSRGELREQVARLAHALSALGLGEGDRVVAVMRNDGTAVLTALAVTALGATLSTTAPEMGVEAILDRFAPLAPKLLFAHTAAREFDSGLVLAGNVAALAAALPTLQGVIRLDDGALPDTLVPPVHALDALLAAGDAGQFVWRRFPFNHPLFIMFSSGTTGKPKCIVHGAGGALLEHLKEHQLHTDLRPGDKMYFHTSCAWMMWNWQLSALASGVEIVTYDGAISSIDKLWRLAADERVTVFGTSPAYLRMCEDAGLEPDQQLDLGALRAILSTGSVLYDQQFSWVRDHVKSVPLQSISGGTDILGCFVLGNPNLPVHAGQAQCRSLGLDVQAWDQGAPTSGVGQLVCTQPFPSRPLGFFGDTDGSAFHAAYFSQNPGVWTHGDLIEFSPGGTARLHGRCDGVMNVRGIKIAPGEIYRALKAIAQIREAMVVEQRACQEPPEGQSEGRFEQRIVLLLILQEGIELSGALIAQLRRDLARRLSSAHVPDLVLAVDELPVTHNGKFSEAAARNALNGLPIDNAAALRNPGCLDAIRSHPALHLQANILPVRTDSCQHIEQYLQAQWEKLLGFSPIGLDDNFFELGGNSLLAARLLAEVNLSIGRPLGLATLLLAPTIRRLAAMIEEGAPPQPASPAPVLVRAGSGAPLFLVHGISGTVMECWALVRALHTMRPVYGLQARGLDGEQPPQQQVEDIAASYVEQMRSVQPSGPYAIVGYSFGGLIALEIAQQLHRAGQAIELLCLLDTYVQQDALWSAWMRYRCECMLRKLSRQPAAKLPAYLARKLVKTATGWPLQLGRTLRHRTGQHPANQANQADQHPAGQPQAMPLAQQQVREKMTAAMAAYQPQPYHGGPIVYVHAANELGEYFDPMPLWRRIAQGGLMVVDVPDGHYEMVAQNAPLIAAALDLRLHSA